ncbi:hypothetical protein JT358_13245 [Micrococcales bacterium 31B]|nr:hypothetical protein [Micrococcales bacterium 31B]
MTPSSSNPDSQPRTRKPQPPQGGRAGGRELAAFATVVAALYVGFAAALGRARARLRAQRNDEV